MNRTIEPIDNIGTAMNIVGNTLYIHDFIIKHYRNEGGADPNTVTSEEFLSTIRNLGENGDIDVRINSKGGELSYSLSIYQALRECKSKVTTIVDGYAYSCAAWVMLAGDERQITPGGIVMTHNPILNATVNSPTSLDSVMPQWNASRDSIANIIVDRTGLAKDEVYNMMDAQTFMNADEAIRRGFCTSKRDGKAALPKGVGNYLPSEIRNAIPEETADVFNYDDLLTKSYFYRSKMLVKPHLTNR